VKNSQTIEEIIPMCKYVAAYLFGCALKEGNSDKQRKILWKMAGELDCGIVGLGKKSILGANNTLLTRKAQKTIAVLPKSIDVKCPHCKKTILQEDDE
jgi:hypothetical protein